jgi:chromate reductase
LYDQDIDITEPLESVRRLREAWGSADAILFSTPEYNGSIPGVLKNAVDWASRPVREAALTNKTVSVIGASNGQFGAMWAQADLRKVLGVAGARVVGDELPVARASEKFDHEGRLLDAELFERLRLVLGTLAAEAAGSPAAVAVA